MASTGTTIQYLDFGKPTFLDARRKYPAYEIGEQHASLSKEERFELKQQQKPFEISVHTSEPGYEHGLIGDFPKRVRYGGAPGAYGKQKRVELHLLGYTFVVQQGPKKGEVWQVLWDYQTGHVRLTAMFRALGHQKTEPKNAIDANSWGSTDDKKLDTVCFSITGGNLGIQGYFMPYHCARELCLTFCYDIRWALTPVFGPTFAYHCLAPNDPKFGKYQIRWGTFEKALQEHKAAVAAATHMPAPTAGPSAKRESSHLSSSDQSSRAPTWTRPARTRRSSHQPAESVSPAAEETSTPMSSPPVSPKTRPASRHGWTPLNVSPPTPRPSSSDNMVPIEPPAALPTTTPRRRSAPEEFVEHDSEPKRARFKETGDKQKKKAKKGGKKAAKKAPNNEPEEEWDGSLLSGLTKQEVGDDLKRYFAAKTLLEFARGSTSSGSRRR